MPEVHDFRCEDFDPTDNEATLINLDYWKQGRYPVVIAFSDRCLMAGHIYKGFITGTHPSEFRFVLSENSIQS